MKKIKTLRSLKKYYIAAVAELPQVHKVVFYAVPGEPLFWTLIDAPPFQREPRFEVYSKVQELLAHCEDILPDFRLVNSQEWEPEWKEEDILPSDGEVIYQRQQ